MPAVTGLGRGGAGYTLTVDGRPAVVARSVVVATGVSYRRLGIAAPEALVGAGVFYGAAVAEAQAMAGRRVFVAGGGNSAGRRATLRLDPRSPADAAGDQPARCVRRRRRPPPAGEAGGVDGR